MNNILIISATSRNNLRLAEKIHNITEEEKMQSELLKLENYNIPLYTSLNNKECIPTEVETLAQKFLNANAFIICAPEYNGSIPPILTNLIAWITISTDQWREVFNGKMGLIATHSAGTGQNFLRSMRIQLNHLGVIVLPRTIVVNNHSEFNSDSCRSKVKQLISLILH